MSRYTKICIQTLVVIFLLISTIFIFGCTKQAQVFEFGGTAEIKLQPNQKLVNMTWKNDNLWFLTRPMITTDSCQTYSFYESSSFGVYEGTLIIKEIKTK